MPSGATPHIPEPMHDLVTALRAPCCCLGDRDGQIRPRGVQGLYASDTRVLHGAELTLDGLAPVGLGRAARGAGAVTFHAIVPGLGDASPDPTVRVERVRTVRPDGMEERIRVRSTAAGAVRTTVVLRLEPDATPLRTARSGATAPAPPVRLDGGELRWQSAGNTVSVAAPGASVDPGTASARWHIELRHAGETTLTWSVRVGGAPALLVPALDPPAWSRPVLTSTDPRLARLLDRSLDDLALLRLADPLTPDGAFIAGGVPWYLTLFGRDSLWAARMMLPLGTGLAEGTLRTLANRQGDRVHLDTGEEPGKIMHELRRDNVWDLPPERSGPTVYYGTVDATPLWINLLADAWRWGMPAGTVAAFLPHLRRALGWLAQHADGFVSYRNPTGTGLANQGWKDSGNAVRFHDGAMAAPPIALCEVQGYAHRAALDAADLFEAFDGGAGADEWRAYAGRLATRFRDRFWVDGPLGPQPALALDGEGRPVDALTSNIGHLLGTGLLSPAEQTTVARLLGSPALAGGYGLRTMSDLDAAFDPLSYHCGSIWPHDTAIALLGLATMAPDPDARATAATLVDGLLTAAEAFGYRLPELFCGDARGNGTAPLPHPAACRPQAWSATAAVALLQAVLGLSPGGTATALIPGALGVAGLRRDGRPLTVTVDADGTTRAEPARTAA